MPQKRAWMLAAAVLLVPALFACGDGDSAPASADTVVFGTTRGDRFERAVSTELCRRAALDCEWITTSWFTIIPDLQSGKFDMILASMSITDQREELIDFTEPYYPPAPSVYLVKADAGDRAFEGTVGAIANTIYADYFTEQGREFERFEGNVDLADAVMEGDVEAVLVDHSYALEELADHEGRLKVVGPSVLLDRGLGIGVREGSELKAKLDAALAAMKSDGTLNALIREHLGDDASTFD